MTEWMSARGAAEILSELPVGRTLARRILAAGLAGEPVVTAGATPYDVERVRALLGRPFVEASPPPSDRVLLEVRVRPGLPAEEWSTLTGTSPILRAHLRILVEQHLLVPMVVTCSGFVLGGAEVVDALAVDRASTHLVTRPAGSWFAAFDGRRMSTGPGNAWRLWLQPEVA